MKKGYIAGKLFKAGDQKQRIYEKETLAKEIDTVEWFNPLTDNPSNDKSKLPLANDIFEGDTEKVLHCNYIVAELDDEDPGVCMELGIAFGTNFMRGLMINLIRNGLTPEEVIIGILNEIPEKRILAHLTDIRKDTAGMYEENYIPVGFNQFVMGGIEQMGEVYSDFDTLVEELKKEEGVANDKE